MALPSVTAIKGTVIDDKVANINNKKLQFNQCANSHTSKNAKIIKDDITQHHVDIQAT